MKKGVNKWMKSFLPNAVLQDFALLHKVLLILFQKKKKKKQMQKVPVIFIHFNLFTFSIKDYSITWVDDTHALAVFASQAAG